MDEMTRFEGAFGDRLRAFGMAGVRPVDSAALAHAVAVGQQRGRRPGSWLPWQGSALDHRALAFAVALGLLVAMLGGALLVGARLLAPSNLDASLPANGWIAFTVSQDDPTGVDPDEDIWFMGLDGDARRVIGDDTDGVHEACPSFSRDGRSLVYGRVEGHDLLVGDDGMEIADSATFRKAALVIADVSVDGQVTERLAIDVGDGLPAPCPIWSPDGVHLAFGVDRARPNDPEMTAVGSEVRVVDLADGSVTVLRDLLATDLEWSPDGDTLAIASGLDEHICCWALRDGRIHLYSPSSGAMRTLDQTLGAILLSWSPDGRNIAYQAVPRVGDDVLNELRVTDIETGQQQQLVGPFEILEGIGPVWSPDGRSIAYHRGLWSREASEVVLLAASGPWDELAYPPGEVVPATAGDSSDRLNSTWTTWSPDGRYLLMKAWGHAPDSAPGTQEEDFLVAMPVDSALPPVVLPRIARVGEVSWGPAPSD